MTDKPGDLDPPHPELPTQTPLIFDLKMGDVLYRHHQIALDPIYFGTTGKNRFDDPACPAGHAFGVLYAAEDLFCRLAYFLSSCRRASRRTLNRCQRPTMSSSNSKLTVTPTNSISGN